MPGAMVRRALHDDVQLSLEVKVFICGLPHALIPKVSQYSLLYLPPSLR